MPREGEIATKEQIKILTRGHWKEKEDAEQ